MAKQSSQLQTLADHELEAADRMKWWGIFLMREKRRLQGIANAVQGIRREQQLPGGNSGSNDWNDVLPETEAVVEGSGLG